MRSQVTVAVLLALGAASAAHAEGGSLSLVSLNIDSPSLDQAVTAWSEQTGYQVLIPADQMQGGMAAPVLKGTYTPEGALKVLLARTNLEYQFVNARTVALRVADARPRLAANQVAPTGDSSVAPSPSTSASARTAQKDSDRGVLAEITVTAQKRSERLQDVPVPVTAVNGQALVDTNQVRLVDYYTRIPGLTVTPDDTAGGPKVTIRGITTGGTSNPTVSTVVDEVPYGASVGTAGGYRTPDVDPSDLAHVEVLRGPQGTLYGASSLGGLLKYVTVEPSTERFSGRVQGGMSGVKNGDEAGYNVRAAVNVPISDEWALRASGFTLRDPGYIDDPNLGINGVNERTDSGGRVSVLWRPSQAFSVKLSALLQDNKAEGSSFVDHLPGLGDLQQRAVRGTGGYHEKIEVYSLNLNANLGGGVDLTSVTGYSQNDRSFSFDLSPLFGATGAIGFPSFQESPTDKFTQEIRFSAPLGPKIDWLFGGFYNHEETRSHQNILIANVSTGTPISTLVDTNFPNKFEEVAVFTDVTFHFTDRFDMQVGGRRSENRQSYSQTNLLNGAAIVPLTHTKDNSFTYLVTPRFEISRDLMVYARFASGYRPGGPNTLVTPNLPPAYGPDKTRNYEIGIKGNILDQMLTFDASVYYIDWQDIQLKLFLPSTGASYVSNGSRAKSQGVEFSVESRPWSSATLAAWVAWNTAVLTEDMPVNSTVQGIPLGFSGDRLPHSSRFSGTLSLDQGFPLVGDSTGFVGASVSYVGNRVGVFSTNSPRQDFPAYAQTDVRGGVRYDTWTLNLYVNNVTDKRAFVGGGLGSGFPYAFRYIQPRTFGLSLAKSF